MRDILVRIVRNNSAVSSSHSFKLRYPGTDGQTITEYVREHVKEEFPGWKPIDIFCTLSKARFYP